jgi:hypothetical protein
MRRASKTTSEKSYYKDLSNALYGKFLENKRKRFNMQMCTTVKKLEKYLNDERLVNVYIYDTNLVGVHFRPKEVKLDNLIAVGAAVLDISKEIMYRFFFEHVQRHRSLSCARVLGGDTDSLMLAVTMRSAGDGKTVYNTLLADLAEIGLLDTSNYSQDHPLYSRRFEGTLGAFKDEFAGKIILELVFLRPKSYSFLYLSDLVNNKVEQRARCKGVSRRVVCQTLNHDRYRECIQNRTVTYSTARRLGSHNQQVYLMEERKLSLGFFDSKRAWTDCNYSLPFGHFRLLDQ